MINDAIEASDGVIPLPFVQEWMLDYQTPQQAVITSDDKFQVGIKGLFFDESLGEEEPPQLVPSMPYYDKSYNDKFQNHISVYTIQSFFDSLIETSGLHGWTNSTEYLP